MQNPWYIVHASRSLSYGAHHLLELWRYINEDWTKVLTYDIGEANIVVVRKLQTRSTGKEELLVWRRFGESMGSMSYEILCTEEGEVIRLLGREGVAGAYIFMNGRIVEEHAGDRVTYYTWDGIGYVANLVVRHRPTSITVKDFHYSVSNGKIHGPQSVTLKVGDKFRLLRDDFTNVIVRQLYSAKGVIASSPDGGYIATGPGETQIDLIPNVYDWDNALVVTVTVLDKTNEQ